MSQANCFSQFSTAAARAALALAAVVTLGTLDATPARAQGAWAQGAWCAHYSGRPGGTNCGFYTLQQCREAISGVGGECSLSPYVRFNDPPPRRKARRGYQ
jgi:hypothetical protein